MTSKCKGGRNKRGDGCGGGGDGHADGHCRGHGCGGVLIYGHGRGGGVLT